MNSRTRLLKTAPLAPVAAAWCLLLAACGPEISPPLAAESAIELAPAGLVAESPSVSGRVVLLGGPPKTLGRVIDVGGNPFCSSHGQIIDPAWKMDAEGGLADVVITVSGSPRASNVSGEPALIDQRN
mgnify:FL=1